MKKIPPRSNRFLMILISILALVIHLNILTPAAAHAAEPVTPVGEDVTVLAFTSDVHNADNNTAAIRQSTWIDTVLAKYGKIDAMGFCGDMGAYQATESEFWAYSESAMNVAHEKGITDVYTTGNHEFQNGNFSTTSSSMVNNYIVDAEGLTGDNYAIYCLGTENWNNSKDNYTGEQIAKLQNYLANADPDKPIIVLTHFPLHCYSNGMNRYTTNADGVIEALNEAAKDKKIVLLWGHNHTVSDANYDEIYYPGSIIEYSSGNSAEIRFYYGAAGCMSDSEYGTGSAYVKGKGLVITIDSKDKLGFTYYDANGNDVTEYNGSEGDEEGSYYRLTDHLTDGKEYLIVNINSPGTGYALTNNGASSSGISVKSTGVSVRSGDIDEDGVADTYIQSRSTKIPWATTANGDGYYLTNNKGYLEGKGGGIKVYSSKQNANRYWSYVNNQLLHMGGSNNYTVYYNNGFTATYNASDATIFIYEKLSEVDLHRWDTGQVTTPPTCTETGVKLYTCTVCGKTREEVVEATGHSWDAGVVTTPPTCTETGTRTCTCTSCGDKKDFDIDATGHDWDAGTVVTEPKCTETGMKKHTCNTCGDIWEESLAALGHTEKILEAVAPTCTETGLTQGKVCTVCNEILTAQQVIPAKGHNWNNGEVTTSPTCTEKGVRTYTCTVCQDIKTETIDANGHTEETIPAIAVKCTEDGWTAGKKCSVCGEILEKPEKIEAPGHTEKILEAVAPTCTETGLTEGKKCSVCGEVLLAQETIAATGHTEVILEAVAPTCTETGLTEGKKCSVCGQILTAQQTVEALGHSWGDGEVTTSPTCTEKGVRTYTCARCGDKKTETIAALGHTEKILEAVVPTCTQTGLTQGKVCTVCNEILTAQQVIPAKGHNWNNGEVTTPPTCTEEGIRTYTCTVCQDIKTETIYANGHTEETIPAVAVTCTEDGWTAGKKCSVCGEILKKPEKIEAPGHTEKILEAVAPTCTKTGLTEGKKCSVCGEILLAQETIAATGHKEETMAAVAPTCTETGLTEGKKCSVCGQILTAQQTVKALGHSWGDGEVTTSPTCTEKGVRTYTCARCGNKKTETIAALGHTEKILPAVEPTCTETGLTQGKICTVCEKILTKQEVIPANGHSWDKGKVTTPATCTEDGERTYTCSVCNGTRTETIEATGHKEEAIPAVEVTCTEAGWTAGKKCSVCGEILTASEKIEAPGHTEKILPAKEPTCTETGLTEGKKCSVCGQTLVAQETIAATGHKEETMAAVAATCTEDGLTAGKKCSVCGEILVAQETVKAAGHSWDKGKVTTPATCTKDGEKTYTCSVCNVTKTETIEAAGHKEETIPAVAPTCTETGLTEGKKCSVCGEILLAQETVKALGHSWDKGKVTTPATCTEDGEKTYTCGTCGATKTETVKATGHKEETLAAVAPTCTETGLTEGKKCSVCGEILLAQETISATGHKWDEGKITKEPTPTETGVKNYTCSACGATREEILPATDHRWDNGKVTKKPTCTEDGIRTYTCIDCGETMEEVIAATGHTEEILPGKPAACTEDGLTVGKKCTVCGEILKAQETIKAAGHSWNEGEITTSPTCTKEGEKTYICQTCGDTRTETVKATGHKEETIPAVAATCTEDGLTEGKKCSVCGEILTAQEVVEATGHKWDKGKVTTEPTCTEPGVKTYTCQTCGEVRKEAIEAPGHTEETIPAVPATCTEDGLTEGKKCSVCGEILIAQVKIEATGHIEEAIPGKPATCTEDGLTEGKKCSICGEILTAQQTIKATGHSWDEGTVTVEPTATEDGVMTYTCTECGETTEEVIKATGHKWDEGQVTKKPTCTEEGIRTYTCTDCGDTKLETIPATGHTEETIAAVPATCTETGLTEGTKCSVCGEILKAQETIKATGHSWDEGKVTTQPTCTQTGVKTYTCTACDATKEESIPATGHTWDEGVVTTEPTCTEIGITTYTCTECKATREKVIEAAGHIWEEDYTVDVEPTETSEGSKSIHCAICHEIKPESSQPIDKLDPDPEGGGQTPDPDVQPPAPGGQDQGTDGKSKPGSKTLPGQQNGIDGTPAGKGASYAVAEKAILTATTDEGPAGTKYGPLNLKSPKQTKKSITLKWNKVKGATKYVIYGNKCGRTIKMKKLAIVTGKTKTFKKVAGKKIAKGKYYKFIVVALDKNNLVVSTSKVVHVASKGGKAGNDKRVVIKKPVLAKAKALKAGKKLKLNAKAVHAAGLKVKKHRAIHYESSNTKIAVVSKKGVITARKKGTCYVYAYAQDGVSKAIKVVVK